MTNQADLIIQTAMAKRLPTMFQDMETVANGALASYGFSYYAIGRLLAKNVQSVLLGADPGDLPIEQLDRPLASRSLSLIWLGRMRSFSQ